MPEVRRDGHPNLLHDTWYRRVRSALSSAAHRADDALTLRQRRPIRVLFEAASPMSLAVFAPVYQRLRDDSRLEFWFGSCSRTWNAQSIFSSAGITGRVVDTRDVRWSKFDAYINTDFWDMTWLPRRPKRVHLFHGVAGKYELDAPVRIAPVVATFDRLMFPNHDRLRRYVEAGLVDGQSQRPALIGYPKVDCLVDGSLDRARTLAQLGISDGRPVVLYAPTWSPYSSLNSMGAQIIASLARLDVNVIVKLHDRSYDSARRGSGGVDWNRELHAICAQHGAHLVRDADASPWLHAADVLVTDHSSVGFEFMLLDRPIVVVDSPDLITHARVNPDKVARLRGAAFLARSAATIGPTVRDALDNQTLHHVQRRQSADHLFFCPGTATARAVECIYDLLSLPLPDGAGSHAVTQQVHSLTTLARTH